MSERFENIDSFISGKLDAEQLKAFEKRIIDDPEFAEDVSFYLATLAAVRSDSDRKKKERFKEISLVSKPTALPIRYLAAAAVIIITSAVVFYAFFSSPSPQTLASRYIKENLSSLPVKMDNAGDSLQLAVAFYNKGELVQAYAFLQNLVVNYPDNYLAKEYAGIVSLRLGKYDQALEYFEMLSKMPGLYANPGNFYYSLTLLKRNRPGDVQRAKTMLQQIVAENGANANAASTLLREL